jgi:hypothetical protein
MTMPENLRAPALAFFAPSWGQRKQADKLAAQIGVDATSLVQTLNSWCLTQAASLLACWREEMSLRGNKYFRLT